MSDPYSSPQAQEKSLYDEKVAFWRKVRTFSILLFFGPPLLGLAGTAIGMSQAFKALAETGQAEPADLSGPISLALLSTAWGLLIALLAIIPLVLALMKLRFYQKKQTSSANENY